MRAYSLDLRQRIVRAIAQGTSRTAVAAQFQVAVRTADRYVRQAQHTGDLTLRPSPGRPRCLSSADERQVAQVLHEHPAARLPEYCQRLALTTGTVVSPATMSRTIIRLGWTQKKGRWPPGNATTLRGLPGGRRCEPRTGRALGRVG